MNDNIIYSDEFKRWFGDWENDPEHSSKVVDEKGKPMMMYHGDAKKGELVFRRDLFFSPNREYAGRYTRGTGEVRDYYLNIRHPFDLRNERDWYIFKEFKNGYDPCTKPGEPMDWAEYEYEDLQDYLEENYPGEYDGVIMNEGADGGYGLPVIERGLSYVPFREDQIRPASNGLDEIVENVIRKVSFRSKKTRLFDIYI